MSGLTFGVRVPNSGPLSSIDNIVRTAKESEALGFDAIWVHDHVVWSSEMHRHHISSGSVDALADDQTATFFESMTTLSYLAAETERVKLGVACLVMPTRNPIYAAKQAATLDHLSKGRLQLGVGLGSKATQSSSEFDVFQVDWKKRAPLTDEYIAAPRVLRRPDDPVHRRRGLAEAAAGSAAGVGGRLDGLRSPPHGDPGGRLDSGLALAVGDGEGA
jgi:alkanesulfonate monooxygenase SsuD/methylene tetrahydromethanopterin reductase-like flavin-dependent oxidoreductase (luciferase family)